MKRNFWLNLFLVCIGVLVGTLVASLTKGIPFLSFLSYGMTFGMPSPAVFDLQVISFTFGVSVDLNISVILFIILSLVLGHLIAKK